MSQKATRVRRAYHDRRKEILSKAVDISRADGPLAVTASRVARELHIARTLVVYYFHGTDRLRREAMLQLLAAKDLRGIALGIAARNSVALAASRDLQEQAVSTLLD